MSASRYENTTIFLNERSYATQTDYLDIKHAIENGSIATFDYVVKPLDRLDILANRFYQEAKYWWIIAIANNIGWAMQIAAGTTILIPVSSEQVISRLGS